MSINVTDLKVEQLTTLLEEKKHLYDQMISDNMEFDQVKTLFTEIRVLEQLLKQTQEPDTSIRLAEH